MQRIKHNEVPIQTVRIPSVVILLRCPKSLLLLLFSCITLLLRWAPSRYNDVARVTMTLLVLYINFSVAIIAHSLVVHRQSLHISHCCKELLLRTAFHLPSILFIQTYRLLLLSLYTVNLEYFFDDFSGVIKCEYEIK